MSDSLRPRELLLCPWDSPDKNIRVGYHALLQGNLSYLEIKPRSPAMQADSLLCEPPGKSEAVRK